ncbi:MAG TPA: hypothetical protein DEP23_06795 [Ruminococcaceae bacterium]|nr:hypothetical protein [Oscillospiraceae bacterium]
MATDNPQLLVKMELENRVSELRLLQRNYQNEQAELSRNIERLYPASIKQYQQNIREISADLEFLKATHGKDFVMTLQGKTYDERTKAGEMLLLFSCMLSGEEYKDKAGEITVGEFRGLTISIHRDSWGTQTINLAGKHHYTGDMSTTEIGAVTRIENMAERIPRQCSAEERELSEVQNQLEEAKRQYGQPFVYETELSEKSARLTEVNTDLELGKADDEEVIMDENGQGPDGEENRAAKGVFACVGAEV